MNKNNYSSYSFLLDRTARKVKQYAQQQFKLLGFNITVDQWIIIKHLHEKGEMKQYEMCELTAKDKPTLTRIIDLLCNKNYVSRTIHPEDRRSFIISLTEEGKEKVKQMAPKIKKIRLKAWEGLTEEDFDQFQRILNKIYKNLD